MSRLLLPLLIAAAGLPLLASIPARAGGWTAYVNARFGAAAEVPATGFTRDKAPQNGDGQSWTSHDGLGHISVYGSHIAVAPDFDDYRDVSLDTARADGVTITYSAHKAGWFAWSGTKDGDIVYMKAIQAEACGAPVAEQIYLRYPADQRARYDAIVQHLSRSLHAAPPDCE